MQCGAKVVIQFMSKSTPFQRSSLSHCDVVLSGDLLFNTIVVHHHSRDLLLLEIFSFTLRQIAVFQRSSLSHCNVMSSRDLLVIAAHHRLRDLLLPEIFSLTSQHVTVCKIFSSQRSSPLCHSMSPFARSSPPGDLLFDVTACHHLRDHLLLEIFSLTS